MAALGLLGLAVLVGLLVSSTVALTAALEQAERGRLATRTVQQLSTGLMDQETALRGYVLTTDNRFRDPYQRGRMAEAEAAAELAPLLADSPVASESLRDVLAAAETWRAEVARPQLRDVRPSRGSVTDDAAVDLQSKQLFDVVREEFRTLQDEVLAQNDVVHEQVARAQSSLRGALVLAIVGGAGILLASAVLYRRWVAVPVERLAAEVRAISSGRHPEPLRAGGPTEIRGLSADIERMRQEVMAQTAAAQRADQALDQQAGAVAALRASLRPAMPSVPGLHAVGHLEPAEGVLAGDWYDVLDLGGGRWAAVVVDVSGHGPAAGTLALRLKALLLPALRDAGTPAEAVSWTVRSVGDWGELFATAALAVGDATGLVRFVGCGHPPAVLCRAEPFLLDSTGPLLSTLTEDATWDEQQLRLAPTDRLVLYTDGLIETRNAQGEEFGEDRLAALVCRLSQPTGGRRDGAQVVRGCLDALHDWSGTGPRDDRTLLVLEREGRG